MKFAFLFLIPFRIIEQIPSREKKNIYKDNLLPNSKLLLEAFWYLPISVYNYVPVSMSVGEGNGNPLQYSCLENPVDRGAWWAAAHGVAQSQTRLKRLSMHALKKEMATHSRVLAWRIPGTEEPGWLPSMGSHRVGHD